ncbi:hypothetical protein BC332_23773 [Capsicum chinense]|nr:hypothetical protein BC332_23773 [Capsicum chinense]
MKLGNLNSSGNLLHCMLLLEVKCNKKNLMTFYVKESYIEFTLDVFGLVTGLSTKSSSSVLLSIRKKEGGSRLLNTYFDGANKLKMGDLNNFMETRKSEVQNNLDVVKLAEIYILGRVLLGRRLTKLKADGDILSNKQPDNLQGESSRDPMVDDQYDDSTENRSEKKRRAEEGKNAKGHSNEKEEAAEERATGLGHLNMEEMRQAKNQEKNAGAEDLLPFPLVEEFSKYSPYSELQDFGGTKVDEDNIDETKNCGDVDSIINNVISSVFAASSSLPTSPDELGGINNDTTDVISDVDAATKFVNVDSTTCVVEIYHDEQESTRVSPMKSKVSPLKPKGSPMKKRAYIRKKKGSKAFISDVACELNSMHLYTIFYYMRKKAKYEPNIVVKFTTTDFVFRNKIDALYHDFVKNGKDFFAIPEKHEVEEYIRGFYCDANVPWNKVNFYLDKGIAKSENDTLPIRMVDELPQQTQCDCGVFICAFAEYVIHGRDIPKEIDIGHVHMRYGALLWDYGKRKLEVGIKDNTTEKVGRLFRKEKRKRTRQE